jgi:hypothetical protein
MRHFVYWLFDETCVCVWRHGYVGITARLPARLKNHRQRLGRVFQHQTLFVGTKAECRALEWKLRPGFNVGWNKNPGGMTSPRLGVIVPLHVRQKQSEAAKRRQPMSDTTREKLRIASIGRTNKGRLGQRKSAEERAKIANSHRGMKASEETRQKLSERMVGKKYHLGHHHTEETKEIIRMKKLGVAIHSDEHKKKLSERMKGNAFTKGKPWSDARRRAHEQRRNPDAHLVLADSSELSNSSFAE